MNYRKHRWCKWRAAMLTAAAILVALLTTTAHSASSSHVRLIDRLDRPSDGYCLDIPGTPANLRIDIPMFAHNCKPRLTSDSAVKMTSEGLLRFTEVGLCLTAVGVNQHALPGASLILRQCGRSTPFFDSARFQAFVHGPDGRRQLKGSDLCLTVGNRSQVTYSPMDRWRTLFVEACAFADPKRSRWEFVQPEQ